MVSARVARLSPAAARVPRSSRQGAAGSHTSRSRAAPAPRHLGAAPREVLDAGFLLREDDDRGVALRHGLIGEIRLPRPGALRARAARHRELGRAMAATGAAPAQLAGQWHRARREREHALARIVALRRGGAAASTASPRRSSTSSARSELSDAGRRSIELLAADRPRGPLHGRAERAVALVREALAELDHDAEPVWAASLYGRLGEYQYWDDAASPDCYRRALPRSLARPRPSGRSRWRPRGTR